MMAELVPVAPSSRPREDVARKLINAFQRRYRRHPTDDAHLSLAYHAAVPVALTPDLLYRLWGHFRSDVNGKEQDIPWVAVSDLLLSGLCEEVGHELFEMEGAVRSLLLRDLQEDQRFGPQRLREVADFLLAYVAPQLDSPDPDTRQFAFAQHLAALVYAHPARAAAELATSLAHLSDHDPAEQVRIANLVVLISDPLPEAEMLQPYARSMAHMARGNLKAAASELSPLIEPHLEPFSETTIVRPTGAKGLRARPEPVLEIAGVSLPISRQVLDLGLAYATLGQVEKAIGFYEQALGIDREIGDRRGEGNALGNLGLAYAALGQVEKAIGFYEQHLAIVREIGDRRGEGTALGNLGTPSPPWARWRRRSASTSGTWRLLARSATAGRGERPRQPGPRLRRPGPGGEGDRLLRAALGIVARSATGGARGPPSATWASPTPPWARWRRRSASTSSTWRSRARSATAGARGTPSATWERLRRAGPGGEGDRLLRAGAGD